MTHDNRFLKVSETSSNLSDGDEFLPASEVLLPALHSCRRK